MKRLNVLIIISLVVLAMIIVVLSQYELVQGEEKGQPVYTVRKPPESMDQYYPPKSDTPQYLFAMLAIEKPVVGLMTHVQDGNLVKAREYFKAVKDEYMKLAKMVPEWSRHYWPEKPLDDLSTALDSGDMAKIGAAMPSLMQVCGRCHQETMPAVWARYQKSMEDIGKMMFPLTGAFGATNTYLADGEFDKAREALKGFQKLMDELSESCTSCHNTERTYYVSADVQALLKTAEDGLNKEQPDVAKVDDAMQKIMIESCYKCHKVHIPSSNIQKAWTAGITQP